MTSNPSKSAPFYATRVPIEPLYRAARVYQSVKILRLARLRHATSPPSVGYGNLSILPNEVFELIQSELIAMLLRQVAKDPDDYFITQRCLCSSASLVYRLLNQQFDGYKTIVSFAKQADIPLPGDFESNNIEYMAMCDSPEYKDIFSAFEGTQTFADLKVKAKEAGMNKNCRFCSTYQLRAWHSLIAMFAYFEGKGSSRAIRKTQHAQRFILEFLQDHHLSRVTINDPAGSVETELRNPLMHGTHGYAGLALRIPMDSNAPKDAVYKISPLEVDNESCADSSVEVNHYSSLFAKYGVKFQLDKQKTWGPFDKAVLSMHSSQLITTKAAGR